MKIHNTSIHRFIEYIKNKKLYIFGIGDFYHRLSKKEIYPQIHESVVGFIDNGKRGQKLQIFGCNYCIHGVDFLKTVKQGVILLCGTTYLDEMYEQLVSMELPDEVECFIMPLIWAVSDGRDNSDIVNLLYSEKNCHPGFKDKIEKKIHCFWFSGERKPPKYQRCIDSWHRVCPDYEIIEWNADSYDCGKKLFVKQAYEKKKWAFISDYARLDVIYHYGGIYLDMDVELFKDFEPLLQFDAFFNFGMRHMIELGSGFGSSRYNPFIGSLLQLYENAEFLDANGTPQITKYVQPVWINDSFSKAGFKLNGDMQLVDDMLLLPRRFYTPKDDFFLYNYLQCDETRGIHHFNSEWQPDEYLKQRKEMMKWGAIAEKML